MGGVLEFGVREKRDTEVDAAAFKVSRICNRFAVVVGSPDYENGSSKSNDERRSNGNCNDYRFIVFSSI